MSSNTDDRLSIRELIDLYCDVINQRDWDRFERFWTEDAVWEALDPFTFRAVGREEVCRTIREGRNRNGFVAQLPHAIVIDAIEGDSARAHHTLHIVSQADAGRGFSSIGIYHDELRRCADGWRFSKRSLRPYWHDPEAPGGFAMEVALRDKSPGKF